MDKKNRVVYVVGGKMMRIIVCDDEISTCAEIEQMLRNFAFEKCIKLEVDIFYDGGGAK